MDGIKLFEDIRQAMAHGEPVARYMKTTTGKLNVKILDPITGYPTDMILEGNAANGDEAAILVFWLPVELAYFERANKYHLAKGTLVPLIKREEVTISPNMVTDEELEAALNSKFFSVKNLLDKFTSPVPAERMLEMATKMNKSIGTINAIKAKVAELQVEEFEKV
jgi:hypothetical protein